MNVTKNCRLANPDADPIVDEEPVIAIYPNPSSGDFIVEVPLEQDQTVQIDLYDIAGKLVSTLRESSSEFLIKDEILKPGIYNAVITINELRKVIKIVKTL